MKGLLRAWAAGVLLPALVAAVSPSAAHAAAGCATVQPVEAARRSVSGEGLPPRLAAGRSEPVPLPDVVPRALRSQRVRLSYELDVSACANAPAAALWMFRVTAPYRASAGGQPLQLLNARALLRPDFIGEAWMAPEGVYNGRVPALFALPPGATTVTVDLLAPPYLPSGIVRSMAGPTNLLLPVQTEAAEVAVAYIDAASVVLVVVCVLALLLWLPRRADRSLLWLAVACGLWGLRGLAYFSHKVYLEPHVFEQFNSLNVALTSGALSASILHLLGGLRRAEGRAILAGTALCVAVFAGTVAIHDGAALARLVSLAFSFALVSWVLSRVWRWRTGRRRWSLAPLAAGVVALLGCGVHDLMLLGGALPPDAPSYLFWGFVVMLLGMAAMSGRYVVLTLNRAERSNEELEQHVARKTSELEHSYSRLREQEHESARAQERARLLRDMHDGLGAQLMTALRGVERGALGPAELARSLQDGLDELRLLMDSADMGHYLPGALAAWRNRWDTRLAAAGVALAWHVDESLDRVQLSGEVALQVMRILQEAAANIVKHSHAQHMALDARVVAGAAGDELCIAITDDGTGLSEDAVRVGARGLKNMRYRATEIGARLHIARRAEPQRGTEVLLNVPLS